MRILITGSQGLVGSHLARELERDHELVLLDSRPSPPLPYRFIQGDLRDPAICQQATAGVDAVAHLAAVLHPHVPQAYEINTVSTWNLGEAAAKAKVGRFIFASSINAYGQGRYKVGSRIQQPPYLPIDENVPSCPEDGYGLSKLCGELTLRGLSDGYGMSAYCLRLPGIWRPEWTAHYAPRPLDQGSPLLPTRLIDPWHYIDVRDVVLAFRQALESPKLPAFGVSYLTAADTTRPEPTMELWQRFLPDWLPLAGDRLPGHSPWFSSRRAQEDLAWRPQHTWRHNGTPQQKEKMT